MGKALRGNYLWKKTASAITLAVSERHTILGHCVSIHDAVVAAFRARNVVAADSPGSTDMDQPRY
jgi:hypothetical protein